MSACFPKRELGVRRQRELGAAVLGGCWWVCSSALLGLGSLTRVRARCGARMWLLFFWAALSAYSFAPAKLAEAAFDFTPGWEMTGVGGVLST